MLERTPEIALRELRGLANLIGSMDTRAGAFSARIGSDVNLLVDNVISERVELLANELGFADYFTGNDDRPETDTKKGINTQISAVGAADKNMDINSHSQI